MSKTALVVVHDGFKVPGHILSLTIYLASHTTSAHKSDISGAVYEPGTLTFSFRSLLAVRSHANKNKVRRDDGGHLSLGCIG